MPFFGQVSALLLGFFFFLNFLVQEFDPDECSRTNIFLDNINGNWLVPEQNLLNSSVHYFVLSIEPVSSMDFSEDFFEKTHLLQKVVGWESETPSRKCADPWRVVLDRIGSILCFAAQLWILLAELVGQKPGNVFEALWGTVKTWGRIKYFSFTSGVSLIGKIDVLSWNARFFLLGTLRDRLENLKKLPTVQLG